MLLLLLVIIVITYFLSLLLLCTILLLLRLLLLLRSDLKSNPLRDNKKQNSYKKKKFSHHIKMLNLSLNVLKQIAKGRHIKGYKSMSKQKLLSALELADSRSNFNNARIKKIEEDFNKLKDRFLKPEIKEIRGNLYEIQKKENLSKTKIEEIEQNLIKLEKSLLKLNKYHDYNDTEYKRIRDVENLFGEFDEDYHYEPRKTKSSFNGYCIKYESRGDKEKNYH